MEMLRCILVFLDTQSWVVIDSEADNRSEIIDAVESSHFRQPLEAVSANLATVQDELEEAVDYARKYLSIQRQSYQKIWYKLHISPEARKWPNVLVLAELLFSLPFSNGQVERMFSFMKIIKTDRRTCLHTDTLSDLLEIQVEGPSLQNFSADEAVRLWWDSCCTSRRVNQAPRKSYKPRETSTSASSEAAGSSSSESTEPNTLNDWDDFML